MPAERVATHAQSTLLSRFATDYGMVFVLLILCLFFSVVTYQEQHPTSYEAGTQLAERIVDDYGAQARVVVIVRDTADDATFAAAVEEALSAAGATVLESVRGGPAEARRALQRHTEQQPPLDCIAANEATARWKIYDRFSQIPSGAILTPTSYNWPNFLKQENLLNIANQIAVIAIIAVGMTMVIITGGIDLSVGSLIALSAVVATWMIQGATQGMPWLGWLGSGAVGMTVCCLVAIGVCALIGLFSGSMVTLFDIPPFIVTLGMMLVGSGLAYLISEGQSIYQVPDGFVWLGRGKVPVVGIPRAVVLMLALYLLAHLVMTQTIMGRYIYAVGGNREAARLSGVPVKRILLLVYLLSGLLAGVGGVVTASQLKSGAPTYGVMYELYVIAAVVVGGTSLAGGEGKILGTLIGAFIIAVIQNGMNLTGVESYTQKVVLGLVILGAVLLDKLKRNRAAS